MDQPVGQSEKQVETKLDLFFSEESLVRGKLADFCRFTYKIAQLQVHSMPIRDLEWFGKGVT